MKTNYTYFIDWLIYSIIFLILLIPFLTGFKLISGALILGFFAGMLNRIIRELDKLYNKEK